MQGYISRKNKMVYDKIISCSNFNHTLQISLMTWSVVFNVSVQVHQHLWRGKYKIDKADVWPSVAMNMVLETAASKVGRNEYKWVGVAISQVN